MSKIHELNNVLADQIAAGEVIERPASVVKELVENSLDADSHRIDVLITKSGLRSIRVVDDGVGIPADELTLAFKRHATSKITSRRDLFRVQTMGFRGEALPSIASVADVKMTTAVKGFKGSTIHFHGGQLLGQVDGPARPGTDVTVKELFFNTPARLKYLKSPHTELSHLIDIINRLALANPQVAISLTHDGRELFRSAGNGNLAQVVAAIYGVQAGRKMLTVYGQDDDFQVEGLVSLPELTRAGRQYITLTINHRYVRNYQLTKAIIQGYGSKLMVGRYPFAVLNISLDPFLVDVNVHPAKREVRLSKEPQLAALIEQSIRSTIDQRNLIPDVGRRASELLDKHEINQLNERQDNYQQPRLETQPDAKEAAAENPAAAKGQDSVVNQPIIISDREQLATPAVQQFVAKYKNETGISPFDGGQAEFSSSQKTEEISLDIDDQGDQEKQRFPQLQYIGQLQGTFLLAQASDGLYIIDQHAAQERINYEKFRREIGQVSDDQQSFLRPLVLNYSVAEAIKINDNLDILEQSGLHLQAFGQNSFILNQHPTWFVEGQEESTAREMIDWILDKQHLSVAQFRAKTAIMMSCKRAIKANHHLDNLQAKTLLATLAKCENPFNCPHGRPVLIHFTDTDLEKMFKRIQDSHQPFADEYDEHEF